MKVQLKKKGANLFDKLQDKGGFATGILQEKTTYEPSSTSHSSIDGMATRSPSAKVGDLKLSEVARRMDKKYGFLSNVEFSQREKDLLAPLVVDLALKNKTSINRAKQLLENIVKRPFKEGKHRNTQKTADAKGFNRGGVDTGQLYSNIQTKEVL